MIPKYLIALSLVGLVDAVSYMVVAPSIVFYVLQLGGTKEQYGLILSAFSFASFCAKPFLGAASDRFGFRIPYLISLSVASLGGLLYLLASVCQQRTDLALGMVLVSRMFGGFGAASSALGFAYLAKTIPNKEQTKTSSLLSMLRIAGMASGPGVNVFLSGIHAEWFGGRLHLDPLNSVGLVLLGTNLIALLSIAFFLEEAKESEESLLKKASTVGVEEETLWNVVKSCTCAEILVPILSTFVFNANFQLIETGFAPAASHALSWGPVQTSTVLGGTSIIIFVVMLLVYQLSAMKVPDEALLAFGLSLATVGYSLMYFMWNAQAVVWHFILPIVLGVSSFPFLGAPTRSVFTKMVDTKPLLFKHHGTMQAVLSMSASVAGFVTPSFVAAYVLRQPEEVEASRYHRELSPLALFAPTLCLVTLAGLGYMQYKLSSQLSLQPEVLEVSESTSLMESQQDAKPCRRWSSVARRRSSCHTEAHRRDSACLMGIPQQSIIGEHDLEDFDEEDN